MVYSSALNNFNIEFTVDVSKYKKGVYYLRLVGNNGDTFKTKSFVVQ